MFGSSFQIAGSQLCSIHFLLGMGVEGRMWGWGGVGNGVNFVSYPFVGVGGRMWGWSGVGNGVNFVSNLFVGVGGRMGG